ncbi:MAG: DNA-directed RNA polymerase subunit omega [Mariprofundales bacterium]
MARITIEDCVKYYPNRYEVALLAARRARQLMAGHTPLPTNEPGKGHKPVVQALKEIGAGSASREMMDRIDASERKTS